MLTGSAASTATIRYDIGRTNGDAHLVTGAASEINGRFRDAFRNDARYDLTDFVDVLIPNVLPPESASDLAAPGTLMAQV